MEKMDLERYQQIKEGLKQNRRMVFGKVKQGQQQTEVIAIPKV